LRWPERLPQNPNLKLFVRFTRADGRKFDAEQDLRIAVPSKSVADWTRSKQPPPSKAAKPIETVPIAPAAAPRDAVEPPANRSPATGGDRTAGRAGAQWTPYR
jgi:hypothetical protein